MRFDLSLDRQRQVNGHLVTVEVGIETAADQRMDLNGIAFDQHGFKGLNAHAVKRGGTIQQHRVLANDLFEHIPDAVVPTFEHLFGALDGIGHAAIFQAANDERLIELQGDLLGQAALIEFEIRTHHNHRTGRVVHAFAQEVFAETTLLALDHVGQTLKRPVRGAQHRTTAAAVVKQRIDGLLEHPLFIADDHLGSIEVHQLLEPVVAVDDAAVQIVQVAGGESCRFPAGPADAGPAE